jgi:MFS family permease
MLPWLFFAIPSGILIDRIDRRAALAMANGVRTLLAGLLVLLTASGQLTIWWLYLIIFIYGTFETVYDGAIRAVVPSIVGKVNLPRANSRIEAGEQVVQNLLSGPFTSLLFAVSALIPLGANALVYAGAVVLAIFLPKVASGRQYTAATAERPRVAWYRQFVDGYHFIIANRMLRKLWFLSTFFGLSLSLASASLVLYLIARLGMPEALFGVFLLTGAAGGILAATVTSRLQARWGSGMCMAVANIVCSLAITFIGVVPTLWAAAVGFFFTSFAVTVWNILVMSLRQSIIPGRLLGRVHGTWRTLLWGTMPVGSLIGGLIGRLDLALPFIIGGAASALAGIVYFRFFSSLPNPEDIDNGDEVLGNVPADPLVQD